MSDPIKNVVVTGITESGYKKLAQGLLAEFDRVHELLDELGAPGNKYSVGGIPQRIEDLLKGPSYD